MRKLRVTVSILLLLSMTLSLCGCFKTEPPDGADTDLPPTEDKNTLIHGIETVSYPNIEAVSQYDELSEDQKAAYDAIGGALADIIKNQPEESRSYPIKKRVSMDDCLSVCELLIANFAAAEDILTALTYTDSENSSDHADTVVLPAPDNEFTESYINCIDAIKVTENVLKDIDNDGTEYGKALAIARWMNEKVKMTDSLDKEFPTYTGRKPNTVYGALSYKEADVNGVAKLYDFLCKRAGLETIYVKSIADDGEVSGAWNMICINEKWYHINVKMMDRSDDSIQYFMMPDSVCKYLSYGLSNGAARYYLDRTADKSVAPVAEAYDLYKYYYSSLMDLLNCFESSVEIEENRSYFSVIRSDTDETVISYRGEIKSKLDGAAYYINVYETATEMYNVSFLKKTEVAPTESGMQTVNYKPDSIVIVSDGVPSKIDYDEDWTLTMDIPDYISEDLDNSGTYRVFDRSQFHYLIKFYVGDCIKVDSDYVMDDSIIYENGYNNAASGMLELYKISQGKTAEGYDYVLYSYASLNSNVVQAYIRVTDEAVISLTYNYDSSETHDIMGNILDSVKVNTKAK